jgi:N-acetylneuraminic acid mutarotase
MRVPSSLTPPSRSSHWSVFLPSNDLALIGYGIDSSESVLNDIWALDLRSISWRRIQTDPSAVSPRNGTTAVLVDRKIYLFGGFSGRLYIADFHVIELDTFLVQRPVFGNRGPPGRVGHVMSSLGNLILIWGGYNGAWLSDLWILNIETMEWREVATTIKGRIGAASAVHGDFLYIFGAVKADALIRYRWSSEQFETVKTSGTAPAAEISQASMISVDQYLLLFGGKLDQAKHCCIYGYDIRRQRWFLFHTAPDGETTSLTDGFVDKEGVFMFPRLWSASIVFRKATREVVLFLGQPFLEPPNLGIVGVGPALSVLHLQSDMLDVLNA